MMLAVRKVIGKTECTITQKLFVTLNKYSSTGW